jgi:hypothetical protein
MAVTPVIPFRVKGECLERLKRECARQSLDRSAIMTIALNEYFERLDGERGRTR